MKIRIVVFLCAILGIISVSSQARIFVPTGMDVGRITAISASHSITLDNNLTYVPARRGITINNFHTGDMVSIYYTAGTMAQGRMYFKVKMATKNMRSQPLSQPPEKAVMKTLK